MAKKNRYGGRMMNVKIKGAVCLLFSLSFLYVQSAGAGQQFIFVKSTSCKDRTKIEKKIVDENAVWKASEGLLVSWKEIQNRVFNVANHVFVDVSDEGWPTIGTEIISEQLEDLDLPKGTAKALAIKIDGEAFAPPISDESDDIGPGWHERGLKSVKIEGAGRLIVEKSGEPLAGWLSVERQADHFMWSQIKSDVVENDSFEIAWMRLP